MKLCRRLLNVIYYTLLIVENFCKAYGYCMNKVTLISNNYNNRSNVTIIKKRRKKGRWDLPTQARNKRAKNKSSRTFFIASKGSLHHYHQHYNLLAFSLRLWNSLSHFPFACFSEAISSIYMYNFQQRHYRKSLITHINTNQLLNHRRGRPRKSHQIT